MTREEAIKILKSKMDGSVDTSYEWAETVRMAIKALEQEPKILNTLDFAINASNGGGNYFVGFRNGLRYAKSLNDGEEEPQFESCTEQEPCEDCVNRQAVLNTLFYKSDNNCEVVLNKELQDRIKALPSVTPQQKVGRWIYDNHNWRCSECNETPKTMGYVGTADFMAEHFKFCNHCGAKMVEPQESEV